MNSIAAVAADRRFSMSNALTHDKIAAAADDAVRILERVRKKSDGHRELLGNKLIERLIAAGHSPGASLYSIERLVSLCKCTIHPTPSGSASGKLIIDPSSSSVRLVVPSRFVWYPGDFVIWRDGRKMLQVVDGNQVLTLPPRIVAKQRPQGSRRKHLKAEITTKPSRDPEIVKTARFVRQQLEMRERAKGQITTLIDLLTDFTKGDRSKAESLRRRLQKNHYACLLE